MKAFSCTALLLGAALGAAAQERQPPPEPAVQRSVAEDDHVRIEELRVRGETQNITVKSKTKGVRLYEIVPQSAARDPSQPGGAAGQRVWHFKF